jgi:hypothetical protein
MPSLFETDHLNASVKDFRVAESSLQTIKPFVEQWHYTKSAKVNAQHVFSLMHDGELIGAMIYGLLAMSGQWKRYREYGVNGEKEIIELRRLCCIDETPKNTESYFIGRTIKWLKKNTDYKLIVSYADPHHGHEGTIYKASNFQHIGMTMPGKIIDYNGVRHHDRCVRHINENHYKKTGEKVLADSAVRLIKALESGEAKWVNTPGKHIYIYPLR